MLAAPPSRQTDGSPQNEALVRKLGVEVLPTLQFYRDGKLLWAHKGVVQMETGVGEGTLGINVAECV